jgi:biotin transporter BioY
MIAVGWLQRMTTFAWLFIGHLIGDWLLQNDWMARGKTQKLLTWAGAVHSAIYTTIVMGAVWLAGLPGVSPARYAILGLVVFLSHWWIDAAGAAAWWMRVFHQSNREIVRLVVDQMLHILVLVALTVLFLEIW